VTARPLEPGHHRLRQRRRARARRAPLRARARVARPQPGRRRFTVRSLSDQINRRFGAVNASPQAHAEEAGFTSFEEFVAELSLLSLEYLLGRGG
jgi:hypothetical protein